MHQPVDTLKYDARAGKREISPLAERAALRALNRALALPEGANLLYITEGFTRGFPGFHSHCNSGSHGKSCPNSWNFSTKIGSNGLSVIF